MRGRGFSTAVVPPARSSTPARPAWRARPGRRAVAAGSSTHSRSSGPPLMTSMAQLAVLVLVGEIAPQRIVGIEPADRLEAPAPGGARAGTPRGRRPGPRCGSARRCRACRRACGTSARTSSRAGGSRASQCGASACISLDHRARVDVGRAEQLERPRGAAALPRASCPRASPCRHRRAPSRDWARWGWG